MCLPSCFLTHFIHLLPYTSSHLLHIYLTRRSLYYIHLILLSSIRFASKMCLISLNAPTVFLVILLPTTHHFYLWSISRLFLPSIFFPTINLIFLDLVKFLITRLETHGLIFFNQMFVPLMIWWFPISVIFYELPLSLFFFRLVNGIISFTSVLVFA